MFSLSEKFHEQFSRIQQEFNEWSSFEQFYAAVILTGTLQSLSYRHFLAQLLANNVKRENDKMFNHAVDQANTPAILACLLSEPLDKLFSTLQLYLPLLATMTNNEKLLDTYRDVLIYLDSKLPTTITTTTTTSSLSNEQTQMFTACQQLLFFIRTHPLLQRYAGNIPQLTALAMMASPSSSTNPLHTEEDSHPVIDYSSSPPLRQGLARNSSIRHYQHVSPQQLINFSSDGVISSLNDPVSQRLIRHETNDSGVDLSETANNPSSIGQDKLLHHHPFVAKTASSPTPEQTLSSRPPPVPLAAVLSAPVQSLGSYYSDLRHHHTQQMNSTTTQVMISDEDDNESHLQQHSFLDHTQSLNTDTQLTSRTHEFFFSEMNRNEIENNKQRLGQFYSLRNRNSRYNNGEINSANQGVSQYLGVDSNSTTLRNTFTQANTGMRDVPKWLKNLRLHKYAFFFSQMTYDEMMNLTMEQLKKENITDGACTKILLNIKKLKDRQATLQQCLIDMDNGTSDIKMIIQQLNDLMLTPIRLSNRIETIPMEGDDDEDLPNMIMQVLAKVISSSSNLSTEMGNAMVGLFDRCYKHEAFSSKQRDQLLQWRGKLCHILQKLGKFEFKSMQASSLLVHNPLRRTQQQLKPQISMGNIVSSQNVKPPVRIIKSNLGISSSSYYPNTNYQSSPSQQQQQQNSIPLARQFNSESPHNGPMNNSSNQNGPSDSNVIRRPSPAISKSPTLIFIANENSNEEPMMISPPQHQIPLVPTHSLQEHSSSSSYYQTNPPYITERAGNGSGNLRPSFNYATSTPLRNGGSYLAANQHPILTRKTSIDPYGGENTTSTPNNINENKSKLCKTFSDPSKIRFYNPAHIISMQSASTRPIERPQPSSSSQTMFNMMGSPYPQQQQQFLTQSQPVPFDPSSFGNKTESSSSNNAGMENVYDQRNNHPELESLCRSITDSALCDDVSESSTDHNEEISNSNPPPTSSSLTDAEQ